VVAGVGQVHPYRCILRSSGIIIKRERSHVTLPSSVPPAALVTWSRCITHRLQCRFLGEVAIASSQARSGFHISHIGLMPSHTQKSTKHNSEDQ